MGLVTSVKAFYPRFDLGCEPQAVECELMIVKANGRRYLKTPFAFVDAYGDDDHLRQIGRGYYATAVDCEAYLAAEYPWALRAGPIMQKLALAFWHSSICGPSRVADELGVSTDQVYKLARGHRSFTLKQVKDALKAIGEK